MRTMLLGILVLVCLGVSCQVYKTTLIEKAVVQALKSDARTDEFTFEVSYEGGIITITGHVDTIAQFDAVDSIVKAVPGIKKVVNKVTWGQEDTGGMLQDETVPSPFF